MEKSCHIIFYWHGSADNDKGSSGGHSLHITQAWFDKIQQKGVIFSTFFKDNFTQIMAYSTFYNHSLKTGGKETVAN